MSVPIKDIATHTTLAALHRTINKAPITIRATWLRANPLGDVAGQVTIYAVKIEMMNRINEMAPTAIPPTYMSQNVRLITFFR